MNKSFKLNDYVVNEAKHSITYGCKSGQKTFVGVAVCSEEDFAANGFDVEKGKQIAYLRAQIKQREYDLNLLLGFKKALQNLIRNCNVRQEDYPKQVDISLAETCVSEKQYRVHLREIRNRLKELTR